MTRMAAASPISRRALLSGGAGEPTAHVAPIADGCLARRGVVCQSCRDVCAEGAIRFRPAPGRMAAPEVSAADCTGCGECLAVCPVAAIGLGPATAPRYAG